MVEASYKNQCDLSYTCKWHLNETTEVCDKYTYVSILTLCIVASSSNFNVVTL